MALAKPPILDMTPTGYYAGGEPRYKFHTSFPSRGVRVVGDVQTDPTAALADGASAVRAYEQRDPMGNMGQVCGVTAVDGGYRAVICLYHSNT